MASAYSRLGRDMQVNEALTVRRTAQYEAGADEAPTTVYIRKVGAGTTFSAVAPATTAYRVAGKLCELVPAVADLDTEGPVVWKLVGPTYDTFVYGRVVTYDPYSDISDILGDTSTDGVAIADGALTRAKFGSSAIDSAVLAAGAIGETHLRTNAITPSKLARHANQLGGYPFQLNEATTAYRTLLYRVGVAEAQTITVVKNGASPGVSASAATQVSDDLYALVVNVADLDTLGSIGWVSTGLNGVALIEGGQVVQHDPYTDLNWVARNGGKGCLVYNGTDGTLKTYDGPDTSYTLLGTQTRTTNASEVVWTPG